MIKKYNISDEERQETNLHKIGEILAFALVGLGLALVVLWSLGA